MLLGRQHVAHPARQACPRCRGSIRPRTVVVPKAAVAKAEATNVQELVSRIKAAVDKPNSVSAQAVLDAMLALEKAKCSPDGWVDILESPKARWRLIFTASTANVVAASKKQANKGGIYFPVPAVQRFEGSLKVFENGVFLGPLAWLTFKGPYEASGKRLAFDVHTMTIGIGPWRWSIQLKKDAKTFADMSDSERRSMPFFLYAYVDDDIIVARGKGGGLAVWQAATQEWQAKAGVLAVYK